jgi:Tfp pilus assembly protein PilF
MGRKLHSILACWLLIGGMVNGQSLRSQVDKKRILELVNKAFEQYKGADNHRSTVLFLEAARAADSLLQCPDCRLDAAEKDRVTIEKEILELYYYVSLDTYDMEFVLKPGDKKRFFKERVDALQKWVDSTDLDMYVLHILGFYYSNVEGNYFLAEQYYVRSDAAGDARAYLLNDRGWNFFRWSLDSDEHSEMRRLCRDSAVDLYLKCIRMDPRFISAYLSLGNLYVKESDWARAKVCYDAALRLDPGNRRVYLLLGQYWYDKLDLPAAADSLQFYCDKALQCDPRYVLAHESLETATLDHATHRDTVAAYTLYQKCIAFNDQDPAQFKRMGVYFLPINLDSNLYYYLKAAVLDSSYQYLVSDYGDNFTGDFPDNVNEAIEHYRRSQAYTKNARVDESIGYLYVLEDKQKESIPYFREALALDPGYPQTYLRLGEAFLDLQPANTDSGEYYLKKYYYMDLDYVDITFMGIYLNRFARIYLRDKKYQAAHDLYWRCAKLGNEACRCMALGLQYEYGLDSAVRDADQSAFWFRQAAKMYPFRGTALQCLAGSGAAEDLPAVSDDSADAWDDPLYWKNKVAIRSGKNDTLTYQKINLLSGYPTGVNPLEWEGERLEKNRKSERMYFPKESVNLYGMLAAYSRIYGISLRESYQELNNYENQDVKKYAARIDSLKDRVYDTTVSMGAPEKLQYFEKITALRDSILEIDSGRDERTAAAKENCALGYLWLQAKNTDGKPMAEKILDKTLLLDSTNKLGIRGLSLVYVLANSKEKAGKFFRKYKDRPYNGSYTYGDVFLDDLDDSKAAGNTSDFMQEARQLLMGTGYKLRHAMVGFDSLRVSTDTATLAKAAIYYYYTGSTDTLKMSGTLFYKLIRQSNNPIYARDYFQCLLLLRQRGFSGMPLNREQVDSICKADQIGRAEACHIEYAAGLLAEKEYEKGVNRETERLETEMDRDAMLEAVVKLESAAADTSRDNGRMQLFSARKAVELLEIMFTGFPDDEKLRAEIADKCGGFSYSIITLKDYPLALKTALLAMAADADEPYYKTNLPIAYMLTGEYEKAKDWYLALKDDYFTKESRYYKAVFLEDIKNLEEDDGITNPGFIKIKQLLSSDN